MKWQLLPDKINQLLYYGNITHQDLDTRYTNTGSAMEEPTHSCTHHNIKMTPDQMLLNARLHYIKFQYYTLAHAVLKMA